jgi:hypothetical protein
MEPYKKPEPTSEDLVQVAALEAEFERYGREHPEWRQINLGRRDQTRAAWDEYVRRLSEANYIVTPYGTGENVSVKKPV